MAIAFDNSARTVHLPTETGAAPAAVAAVVVSRKSLRLTDLRAGETGRIVRLSLPDGGCRKRFAEMGLAEGMRVRVASTGDTLMLIIGTGNGTRMGVAARCAETIFVARIAS